MIGQRIASLETDSRRWVQRIWGIADIHTRQKWSAVYPHLSKLHGPVRLLDAGCWNGAWALELAVRHPTWMIVGIDKDGESIEQAEHSRQILGLQNVSFLQADFLNFHPIEPFDVVLSVASAHYLVEMGKGDLLFTQFYHWLKTDGALFLLLPRCQQEFPSTIPYLPPVPKHSVFSAAKIEVLCQENSLQIKSLEPHVGRYGIIAKQLAQIRFPFWRRVGYPLQLLVNFFDQFGSLNLTSASWLVAASKQDKFGIVLK